MTYQQTLEDLYARLPVFSQIGSAAYKEDLHNTIALCNAIGNPQNNFKCIHIAGTNGKGSTSHMLAAILQQAGYRTGLYTSPHLKDFGERIKVNGEMISQDFVIEFAQQTKPLCDEIQPSFFELTVAMAFSYFEKEKIDIAVIETGLGGRLDSTNIITPILSVITNIGYDHMNILGNTLEAIATEKAGIIKPVVPVVIGEYLDETKPIFINKAAKENAPIYFAQDIYSISNTKSEQYKLTLDIEDNTNKNKESFTLDLNGLYQAKNLRTVLCAESILYELGFKISNEAEKFALANVKKLTGLRGRWDVISEHPTVILDVAHNEDGIKQIMQQVTDYRLQIADCNIHFVIGFVKDKDVDKALKLLPKDGHYYFTNAHIPRALPNKDLQAKANAIGLRGDVFDNVNTAIDTAKANAAKDDLIIVCGSVFLIGEVNY
jgi:dihydrofolate synthase / folylpolyglutamate synthase